MPGEGVQAPRTDWHDSPEVLPRASPGPLARGAGQKASVPRSPADVREPAPDGGRADARGEPASPHADVQITDRVYTELEPAWLREHVNRMPAPPRAPDLLGLRCGQDMDRTGGARRSPESVRKFRSGSGTFRARDEGVEPTTFGSGEGIPPLPLESAGCRDVPRSPESCAVTTSREGGRVRPVPRPEGGVPRSRWKIWWKILVDRCSPSPRQQGG